MPKRKNGLQNISEADLAAINAVAQSGIGIAGITYDNLDDIKQELALRLIRKAHLFRRRQQKWGTFRKIVLGSCLADIIRYRMHPKNYSSYLGRVSLNAEVEAEGDCFEADTCELIEMVTSDGLLADNTEKPEIPGIDLKIDMDAFLETLPPPLAKVCKVLKKYPVNDAVRILKISRRTLYRRMETIREGMKKAGLEIFI